MKVYNDCRIIYVKNFKKNNTFSNNPSHPANPVSINIKLLIDAPSILHIEAKRWSACVCYP
ncbi:MAG: hypothetical protein BV459_02080, partial [Thermoplasmata archaeon M11B2D]